MLAAPLCLYHFAWILANPVTSIIATPTNLSYPKNSDPQPNLYIYFLFSTVQPPSMTFLQPFAHITMPPPPTHTYTFYMPSLHYVPTYQCTPLLFSLWTHHFILNLMKWITFAYISLYGGVELFAPCIWYWLILRCKTLEWKILFGSWAALHFLDKL